MQNVQVAMCTIDSRTAAEALAQALLERRLIACANLVPGVESIYRWQDRVEKSSEVLLILKTTTDRAEELKTAVSELHPYDTPELLLLPVTEGLGKYLAWVEKETR
jgi:periplasmic divalent cation tolerance protein